MRFVKAGIFFVVCFVIAWVTIFTFIQEPFHIAVSAKLLWHVTKPYPVVYYLLGAFALGLTIGVGISVYYYVVLSVEVHRKSREARTARKRAEELEEQLEDAVHEQEPTLPAPEEEDTLNRKSIEDNSSESAGAVDSTSISDERKLETGTPDQSEEHPESPQP